MSAGDRIAASVAVGRVVRHGAWSNVVTRAEATAAGVPVPVVQGLVLDVLRLLPAIDAAISNASDRDLAAIDPGVLDLLRIAGGELHRGEKHPAVVVDGTVDAVRTVAPRAAGFANAVLRRLAERGLGELGPDGIGVPRFVDDALRHVMPPDEVDAFWAASQVAARVGTRATTAPPDSDPVDGIPGAWLRRSGAGAPAGVAQDPASVAVGEVVGAEPGWTVVDLAAAPGGKTSHLLEQVGEDGRVLAMDVHRRRVRDAARRIPDAEWIVGDGTNPPLAESRFDAVLVDAPCSGLGTLRRRPEIRYRVTPEEVARLARLQRTMVEAATRLVRPGGRVVYSACTVTPAETIDVVAELGAAAPEGLPGRPWGDGWLMAPHLAETDGMFVAVLQR